ncbi:MAG: HIT family protein [Parasporobacterium sp.]|nr:HIT family protein [Parasporobacterium sp.]
MRDDNCIFCKLANGDIPTMSLYEDEDFNVIFDAGPATVGHCLILPKEHYKNIFEIDEEVQAKAYKLAKKLAPVLVDVFAADGLNVLQNNNEAAGQTVFHYHIHLIPRYAGEKSMVAWVPGEQDKEKLEKALTEIRAKLSK